MSAVDLFIMIVVNCLYTTQWKLTERELSRECRPRLHHLTPSTVPNSKAILYVAATACRYWVRDGCSSASGPRLIGVHTGSPTNKRNALT